MSTDCKRAAVRAALAALLIQVTTAGPWGAMGWAQGTGARGAASGAAGVVTGGIPPPPFGGGGFPGLQAQPQLAPPLPEVPGTLPWTLLAQVKTVRVKDRFVPEFPAEVRQLDRQPVKIVGFMLPLQTGERQSHFLLTVTSQTCAFCVPAGPEGIVEVRTRSPVRVTFDPIVIAGRLEVLRDDPVGVYYRISDGQSVPLR
jgi:hypothetical protein